MNQGIFKPHIKGFGFIQDTQGRSIFVSPKLARNFFYFDTVGFRLEVDENDRYSAHDLYLIESGLRTIAGTVVRDSSGLWVTPEISALPRFAVYSQSALIPQEGDKVVARAVGTSNGWVMDIESILGNATTPFWESELSIQLYKIPVSTIDFPVVSEERIPYKDLRSLNFVTIDAETTRDIDDAVFVKERENGQGWTLFVAIADASSYFLEDSSLDAHAFEKGTTVYFAQRTYPMLPNSISSQAGSLLPNADRRTLVCEMEIDTSGRVENVDVYGAWVKSHGRFSYSEVSKHIATASLREASMLNTLHDLYLRLLEQRVLRGSTPIRSGDYKIEVDNDGRAVDVVFNPWHVAYGMIEECMLAANTSVASWLMIRNVPSLYRYHKGPDAVSLEAFSSYFEQLGVGPFDTEVSAQEVQRTIAIAAEQGQELSALNVFRAAMRPASYRVAQTQHHGLSYDYYTHFTSPLRRYADLTVHRCIKRVLAGEAPYSLAEIERVAAQCTLTDKRAKKATREEGKRLKAWFAQKLIGKTVDVSITGGNKAGFFVQSFDPPLQTFVVTSNLGWEWNPASQCATHSEHGVRSIGDKITVSVESVDLHRLHVEAKFLVLPPLPSLAK